MNVGVECCSQLWHCSSEAGAIIPLWHHSSDEGLHLCTSAFASLPQEPGKARDSVDAAAWAAGKQRASAKPVENREPQSLLGCCVTRWESRSRTAELGIFSFVWSCIAEMFGGISFFVVYCTNLFLSFHYGFGLREDLHREIAFFQSKEKKNIRRCIVLL